MDHEVVLEPGHPERSLEDERIGIAYNRVVVEITFVTGSIRPNQTALPPVRPGPVSPMATLCGSDFMPAATARSQTL